MFKLTPVNGAEINGRAAKYWLLTSTSGNVLFEVNNEKRTVKDMTQEDIQKIPVLFERFDPDKEGGDGFEWFSSSDRNEVLYPYGCNPWDPFYDMDMALCNYTYEGERIGSPRK